MFGVAGIVTCASPTKMAHDAVQIVNQAMGARTRQETSDIHAVLREYDFCVNFGARQVLVHEPGNRGNKINEDGTKVIVLVDKPVMKVMILVHEPDMKV